MRPRDNFELPAIFVAVIAYCVASVFADNRAPVCLNGHPSVAQEYRLSYAVLIGEVVSEKREPRSKDFYEGTSYVVRVRETICGKLPRTITLFSENSSGRFPMKMGQDYLLFVYRNSNRTMVDNCGNSKLLSQAAKEIRIVRNLKRESE